MSNRNGFPPASTSSSTKTTNEKQKELEGCARSRPFLGNNHAANGSSQKSNGKRLATTITSQQMGQHINTIRYRQQSPNFQRLQHSGNAPQSHRLMGPSPKIARLVSGPSQYGSPMAISPHQQQFYSTGAPPKIISMSGGGHTTSYYKPVQMINGHGQQKYVFSQQGSGGTGYFISAADHQAMYPAPGFQSFRPASPNLVRMNPAGSQPMLVSALPRSGMRTVRSQVPAKRHVFRPMVGALAQNLSPQISSLDPNALTNNTTDQPPQLIQQAPMSEENNFPANTFKRSSDSAAIMPFGKEGLNEISQQHVLD
jgi:hypothetical protein